MIVYPILKDPEFLDLEKTIVRVKLINEDNSESIAQFKVPENKDRGINPFWDRILDEFDVEEMRQRRNNLESRRQQEAEFRHKKQKAAFQSELLRQLFDKKMAIFNMPFVENISNEDKAAIRRAPNEIMLTIVVNDIVNKYLKDNNISFIDLFDEIDDAEYQAQNEQQAETPTDSPN